MNQRLVIETLEARITETVTQLLAILDSLPDADLHRKLPVPDANTIPGIVMHVLGSVDERLLSTLIDQPTSRDREAELQTTDTRNAIHARWHVLQPAVRQVLASLPDGYLGQEFMHPRMGRIIRFDAVLNVARHASEHLGEAQLIRDLFVAGTGATGP